MNKTVKYNKSDQLIIDEQSIFTALSGRDYDKSEVRDVLTKSLEMKGLDYEDIQALAGITDPEMLDELFDTAQKVKDEIYGRRLVLFAPMYVSNLCSNECLYCAFRARNSEVKRRALSQEEIARETSILINQGHKRVLLVAGESYPKEGLNYILKSIDTIYKTKSGSGEIRRINVNVAPLNVDEFKELKQTGIGTYQLFQETYHFDTYMKVHVSGKKRDYNWRITAIERAMEAGIDDVGIGVLFGLFDWRFEILALMQHIRHLEKRFGIGPHTISVPRLEPATGSRIAAQPPFPVSDVDFKKIVAILRLAIPYTGIIMSTRETSEMRRQTFSLGVSQISAGSRTNPGGYSSDEADSSQFALGDHRTLNEVICDVIKMGYIPSFCTGCYRLGRTGEDFMDMAKPGLIKMHCQPNAIMTLKEYLLDYADDDTRMPGNDLITKECATIPDESRKQATIENLRKIEEGSRDLFF